MGQRLEDYVSLYDNNKDTDREEGGFALVYKGKIKETEEEVAVKIMCLEVEGRQAYGVNWLPLREVALLQRVSGMEGVITLKSIYTSSRPFMHKNQPASSFVSMKKCLCLVFELMDGNLRQYINKPGGVPKKMIKPLMRDICKGVQSCHSVGVVHRDLRPDNILYKTDKSDRQKVLLKITDVGISRLTPMIDEDCTPNVVHIYYRAPELLLGSLECDWPMDMWSVGCVFAEMLMGRMAFRGGRECLGNADEDAKRQLDEIFRKRGMPSEREWPNLKNLRLWESYRTRKIETEDWLPSLSGDAKDLLLKMLEYNPSKRISAEDALRHPYLASPDDNMKRS